MAKVTFQPANPEGSQVLANYREGDLAYHSATKAVYIDQASGYQFVLKGKNFAYNGQDLVEGTITGATEKTLDGVITSSITDLHVRAKALEDTTTSFFPSVSQPALLKGDDRIIGRNGSDALAGYEGDDRLKGKGGTDFLYAEEGRDRLTGGGGADVVYFFSTVPTGRDIITDFKDHGQAEAIFLNATEFDTRNTKNGLLIECDTGQSVLLWDMRKADIESGDIILV